MSEVSRNADSFEMSFELNSKSKENRVHVPITLCLLILASYVCGGGALFSIWEGWNYLDGSYFCFVTLSKSPLCKFSSLANSSIQFTAGTIGFGDLVPGTLETIKNIGFKRGFISKPLVLFLIYFLFFKFRCIRCGKVWFRRETGHL